jgi:uncharacterized membrane protein YqaE (UPF0057 family)
MPGRFALNRRGLFTQARERLSSKRVYLQTETDIGTTMDVLRILIAILLPPLGVFLQVGIGLHFWLNILLTLFGYIPGIIHAIWIIIRK